MRRAASMVMVLLWSVLYVGCSSNGEEKYDTTLKILLQEVTQTHRQAYRELKAQHPDLEVEFVNIHEQAEHPLQVYEDLEGLYQDLNPDVVITNDVTFPRLASQGYLLNLESMMSQEGIAVEDMHPPVMEWIRDHGNGQVYGLAPSFETDALFYNKTMFDAYGIPHPEDQMTWEELFDLMMRFPTSDQQGDRVYGFYDGREGSPSALLDRINQTKGLIYLDWDNRKITYEDPSWPDIYSLVSRAERSGLLLQHSTLQDGQQPADLFKQNKLAVMLGDYATFVTLSYEVDMEFGAVTQPVTEDDRSSGFYYLTEIYAVNANSANSEAAWEFIQAVMRQSEPDRLPVANDALLQLDERAQVFYELDYKYQQTIRFWEVPLEFSAEMSILKKAALDRILEGESIHEVLQQLEAEGQTLLDTYAE